MCHGYWLLYFSHYPKAKHIYAQTHTEKGVSITKISAYKLDKHAVNIIFGLNIKFLAITQDISSQKFRST